MEADALTRGISMRDDKKVISTTPENLGINAIEQAVGTPAKIPKPPKIGLYGEGPSL
jgi:hypothetical protein